jgi:hypothetical protein
MSFIKRLQEKIDYVTHELEGICLENEHQSNDDGPRVCTDCALAIEIMESEFQKLETEHGTDN